MPEKHEDVYTNTAIVSVTEFNYKGCQFWDIELDDGIHVVQDRKPYGKRGEVTCYQKWAPENMQVSTREAAADRVIFIRTNIADGGSAENIRLLGTPPASERVQ